jgi:hypothetical protein
VEVEGEVEELEEDGQYLSSMFVEVEVEEVEGEVEELEEDGQYLSSMFELLCVEEEPVD